MTDDDWLTVVMASAEEAQNYHGDNGDRDPDGIENEGGMEEEEDEDDGFSFIMSTPLSAKEKEQKSDQKPLMRYSGGGQRRSKPGTQGFPSPTLGSVKPGNMTIGGVLTSMALGESAAGDSVSAQARRASISIDIDALEDKPWRKEGEDISNYFNYGFTEDTWRLYCTKQVIGRQEVAQLKASAKIQPHRGGPRQSHLPMVPPPRPMDLAPRPPANFGGAGDSAGGLVPVKSADVPASTVEVGAGNLESSGREHDGDGGRDRDRDRISQPHPPAMGGGQHMPMPHPMGGPPPSGMYLPPGIGPMGPMGGPRGLPPPPHPLGGPPGMFFTHGRGPMGPMGGPRGPPPPPPPPHQMGGAPGMFFAPGMGSHHSMGGPMGQLSGNPGGGPGGFPGGGRGGHARESWEGSGGHSREFRGGGRETDRDRERERERERNLRGTAESSGPEPRTGDSGGPGQSARSDYELDRGSKERERGREREWDNGAQRDGSDRDRYREKRQSGGSGMDGGSGPGSGNRGVGGAIADRGGNSRKRERGSGDTSERSSHQDGRERERPGKRR